jgi:hypothetical protein
MLAHEIDVLWVPTHPPSLNFCSSSSKAKPEAVQEIRDNTNKSCYVEKYLALVGMCTSLRNLSIFIQLWSISKLRFNKINTNSDITPPNNLDMVTFEILLAWDFVSTKE